MSLELRPLQARDRAQWDSLWNGYLAYYETELPPAQYDLTFARLMGDDPQDFSAIVAVSDGKLVGLTHYLFHRHAWTAKNVCYLQDLYVAPETRGTGAGRALIEAVYDAADAADAVSVYWMTQDFNATARQLYDRIALKTPFIKYQRG